VPLHAFFHLGADGALRNAQVVVGLKPHPDFGRHAKIFAETESGVGSDGALAIDDGADTARRHDDVAREPVDADIHRPHEFFEQNLARVNRLKEFLFRGHGVLR